MSVTLDEVSVAFPFWNSLTEIQKLLVAKSTKSLSFTPKANLHGSANDCLGLIYVKKGTLCMYMLSDEGREITLQRLYSGDTCMMSAEDIIAELDFDVLIDSETYTEVFLLPSSTLKQIIAENPAIESFVYKSLVETFSSVMLNLQPILFQGFKERLAEFLYNEILFSRDLKIKMTHEQIAKHTGSAREVVSRTLGEFKRLGIVSLGRGFVTVTDKEKLQKMF